MKIVSRRDDLNIRMMPGDVFNLTHRDGNGKTTRVLSEEIRQEMHIDTALVVEFGNGELGLEFGLGGVFGKRKEGS